MPLVSILPHLAEARARRSAVALFDTFDQSSAEGLFQAIEERGRPTIIGIYAPRIDKPNARPFVGLTLAMAQEASVPVSVMLDHGQSVPQCLKALEMGFSDVMYDGAKLPMDENIANTRQVIQAARECRAGVEAELGVVGSGREYDQFGGKRLGFTEPETAETFWHATGCDILAVAIGNAHGLYKGKPCLDLDLLGAIRARVAAPLALHGGTGLSDDQFRAAIRHGISKINVFTDMSVTAGRNLSTLAAAGKADYLSALATIRDTFRERALHYLDVFGN